MHRFALLPLLWLVACAAEDPGEPLALDVLDAPDPGGLYVELTLRRTGGVVSIEAMQWLDAEVGLARAASGDHAVVTRDGAGAIEDVVYFSFPEVVVHEGVDDRGEWFAREVPLENDTVATVRVLATAATAELTVIDPAGTVLAMAAPPAGIDAPLVLPITGSELPGTGAPLLTRALTDFPHLLILESGDAAILPETHRTEVMAIHDWASVPAEGRDRILAELRRLPPPVVRALSHIAVVTYQPGVSTSTQTVMGSAVGSVVVFNFHQLTSSGFASTVVHEVAHVYEASLAPTTAAMTWPAEVATTAAERLDATRLRVPFRLAWLDVHRTAVAARHAPDYAAGGHEGVESARLAFAHPYGGTSAREDIAMFAARIVAPDLFGGPSPACDALIASRGRLTEVLAAAYTKILLLRGTGFITREQAEACTGALPLLAPSGIRLGGLQPIPTTDAGFDTGRTLVRILGMGPERRALVELAAPRGIPPRGLHRLGWFAENGFYLDGPGSADYAADGGIVLLADWNADAGTVSGAFLGMNLNYEDLPFGDIPIPFGTFRYQE